MAKTGLLVLDTTVAEAGPTQQMSTAYLQEDKPTRFYVDLAAGDTVVIESKARTEDDFNIIHSFTDETPADVYVGIIWRARRSVDGASADSKVVMENKESFSVNQIEEHA